MTVPAARRDQRLRRFPLRRLRLPVAGGTLSLVVPADDRMAHVLAGAATGARSTSVGTGPLREPPYWATLWPAAVALARWLFRRGDLAGRRALDLGCGLGAAGAAAARLGAAVTFADRDPDALAFAAFNGGQQVEPAVGPEHIATHRLDWHRDTVPGAFDLLLLADVSYRPAHHLPLLRHLRQCLAPAGLAIHADPLRRESDGFLVHLRREWAHRELVVDTSVAGARTPVRLVFAAADPAALEQWLGPADAGAVDRDAARSATVAR